jgi:thiol:disulfide interchange protein DsbD
MRKLLSVLTLTLLLQPVTAQLLSSGGNSSLGSDRPRPLPIEQAFPYFVSVGDGNTLTITWQPAPGHYLYRHQFGFALQSADGSTPQPLPFQLPDGIAKNDQFFGDIEAYYDSVTASIMPGPDLATGTTLLIHYQGCAEWGFCYPPQTAAYPLVP